MIVDRPESHFIFTVSREHVYRDYNYIQYEGKVLTNREYLQHWGKWVIFGDSKSFAELARKIDPLVEKKVVPAAKYDRKAIDEFKMGECVMCVYCDYRQRDDVWEQLESVGVTDKMWVFEKETMERWLPGGHLLEKWIEGKNLTQEKADRIRADTRRTFERMFADEDAECKGVIQ